MSNLTNRYFEKDITHFRNISDKYQMLWLAPARTATRSLCQVLQYYDFKVHTDMIFMKKQEIICPFTPQGEYTHDFDLLPQDIKYKIICSVRNPYSRVVGLLRYHNIFRDELWDTKGKGVDGRPPQQHEFKPHKGGIIETLSNDEVNEFFYGKLSFTEWIDKCFIKKDIHKVWKDQLYYHEFLKEHKPSHYIRTESIEEDLMSIPEFKNNRTKEIDISIQNNLKSNRHKEVDTFNNKEDWRDFYTQEIADLIYNELKEQFDMFGYDKDSWKKPTENKKLIPKNITVTISTKNRYFTTLPSCLISLTNQTILPKKVIIFDDGDHLDLLKEDLYINIFSLFKTKNIEFEIILGLGEGQVKNHQKALEVVTTDLIFRLDDDCILETNVLETLLNTFTDKTAAVSCLILFSKFTITKNPLASSKIEDINIGINEQWFIPKTNEIKKVDHLYSSFMFRKTAATHGYNKELSQVCYAEETLFTYEMTRNGLDCLINPNAIIWHFYSKTGGIRENTKSEMWKHDNVILQQKLKGWGIKALTPQKSWLYKDITYNISFNSGCQVDIIGDENSNEEFIVEIIGPNANDINSIGYREILKPGMSFKTPVQFYKNWHINIKKGDSGGYSSSSELLVEHDINLKNQNVLIVFDSKCLGDTLAWIPYVEEFRRKHNCIVYCATFQNHLFWKEYPEIRFVDAKENENALEYLNNFMKSINQNIYATYFIGWYVPWENFPIPDQYGNIYGYQGTKNPNDYKRIPLQQTASDVLGLSFKEIKPKITILKNNRPIKEKYVCISEFSTGYAKQWNYPIKGSNIGWQKVVDWLNNQGYKVIVISKEKTELKNIIDHTGNFSIEQRINEINHSEFFIGLSSGLAWLAWAINKKVIMISNFTDKFFEFQENCIRVDNTNVCHGCWHKHDVERGNFSWCPENKNFECTSNIKPDMVIQKIKNSDLESKTEFIHLRNISNKHNMIWLAPMRMATKSVYEIMKYYNFDINIEKDAIENNRIICPFTPPENYTHDFDLSSIDDNKKIICSVRNPYSRIIGLLGFYNFGGAKMRNFKELWNFSDDKITFKEWIDKCFISKTIHQVWQEQLHYHEFLKRKPDYLIRFENMEEDLMNIPEFKNNKTKEVEIAIQENLRKNRFNNEIDTFNNIKNWRDVYTQEIADLVYNELKDQFEMFGYDKDSWKNEDIELKNITLITIDGVDPEKALKSILHCTKKIKFGKVKLLSFRKPKNIDSFDNIKYHQIEKLTKNEYNKFIIKNLYDYIDTEFCLIIEPDGLIVNPEKWNNNFLNYDYIGAAWPLYMKDIFPLLNENNMVGNSGFSLRSKKLLEISKLYCPFDENMGNDELICRKYRNIFLEYNIKFAPVDVANRFSIELPMKYGKPNDIIPFGYHGNYCYDPDELLNKINIDSPLKNKNVLIVFVSAAIGDAVAWIPYVEEFRMKHQCNVYCQTYQNELFIKSYPEINFIEAKEGHNRLEIPIQEKYFIGLYEKSNYKDIPLQKTASDILGLEFKEQKAKLTIPNLDRPIKEKYVCISEFSRHTAKYWNYKNGWQNLVDWLNLQGYKVIVISEPKTNLKNIIDHTGSYTLEQRINEIQHCEFMVTISTGLAWIAWSLNKKVVMISGFTKPYCEFIEDNIRIINEKVCNGCFNRVDIDWKEKDWCPDHKGTERQFECTKKITPKMVKENIKKLIYKNKI